MEVAVDKKHIKVLAKAGDFDEILRLYGPKWVKKASEYLAKKGAGDDGANNDDGEDVPATTGLAYAGTPAKDSSAADGANDNGDAAEGAEAVDGSAGDEDDSSRVGELFAAASGAETAPVTAVKGKKKAGLTPLGLGKGQKKKSMAKIGLMPAEEEGDEAVPSDLITPSIPKKSKKKVGLALQPMEDGVGQEGTTTGKKATGQGKGKKDKHAEPGAKKRGPVAPSAYMLWSKESRPEVVASNPGLSFGDLGRKMGEVWKAYRILVYIMYFEIGLLVLFTAPLPRGIKKALIDWIKTSPTADRIVSAHTFIIVFLLFAFSESYIMSQHYREEKRTMDERLGIESHEVRAKMFENQRNLYVSGISIFIVIAIKAYIYYTKMYYTLRNPIEKKYGVHIAPYCDGAVDLLAVIEKIREKDEASETKSPAAANPRAAEAKAAEAKRSVVSDKKND